MSAPFLLALAKKTVASETTLSGVNTISSYYIAPHLLGERDVTLSDVDIWKGGTKTLLLGPPGAGKTTFLHYQAVKSAAQFVRGEISVCPMLIACRDLQERPSSTQLEAVVADTLTRSLTTDVSAEQVAEALQSGNLMLLFDGFDEIVNGEASAAFLSELRRFVLRNPQTTIVISSRPTALAGGLLGFQIARLAGLATEDVWRHVRHLAGEDPYRAELFIGAVTSNRRLAALVTNPLLLTLLWAAFRDHGRLPASSAALYEDLTDVLLGSWDRSKHIDARSSMSRQEIDFFLQIIALRAWRDNLSIIPRAVIVNAALEEFRENGREQVEKFLHVVAVTGILIETAAQTYRFAHLTLLEYYVAKAAAGDSRLLSEIVSRGSSQEIVLFAAGLLDDSSPLIESLIHRGQTLLAARCISESRTQNEALFQVVAAEIWRAVGATFAERLASYSQGQQRTVASDPHARFLVQWDGVTEAGLASHVKGKRLEAFMCAFFGEVFSIVKTNLNTENGELDLILENTKTDPFWLEFGSDVLVECKNCTEKVPSQQVGNFADKVTQAHRKLAFFVSVSGFTPDAMRRLQNHSANAASSLIVPLDGLQLTKMLTAGNNFEEFFKACIRDIRYLQKY